MARTLASLALVLVAVATLVFMGSAFAQTSEGAETSADTGPVATLVHADGTVVEYSSFAAAWDASGDGDTVNLLVDTVLTKSLEFTSHSTITINLNGHTIDCNRMQFMDIGRKATLELIGGEGSVKGTITNAHTSGLGGAIECTGKLHITNVVFSNCSVSGGPYKNYGGAIAFHVVTVWQGWDPELTATNCDFVNCSAGGNGGAVSFVFSEGHKKVSVTNDGAVGSSDSTILGWIGYEYGPQRFTNCTFTNCSSGSNAGAIYAAGAGVILNGCTASGCSADQGGGFAELWVSGSLSLNDSTIAGCTADDGSAVKIWYGEKVTEESGDQSRIWVNNSTITGCTARNAKGGAVYAMEGSGNMGAIVDVVGATVICDNFDCNGLASNVVLGYKTTWDGYLGEAEFRTRLEPGANVHVASHCGDAEYCISKDSRDSDLQYVHADWLGGDTAVNTMMKDGEPTNLYIEQTASVEAFRITSFAIGAEAVIDNKAHTVTVTFPFPTEPTMVTYEVDYKAGPQGEIDMGPGFRWSGDNPYKDAIFITSSTDEQIVEAFRIRHGKTHEVAWTLILKNGPGKTGETVGVSVRNGTLNYLTNKTYICAVPGQQLAVSVVYDGRDPSEFIGWEATGMTLTEEQRTSTSFTFKVTSEMAKTGVVLTAKFQNDTYHLTVVNGTASYTKSRGGVTEMDVDAGTVVQLHADSREGDPFLRWTYDADFIFAYPQIQDYASGTSFTMPQSDLTIVANYESGKSQIHTVRVESGHGWVVGNSATGTAYARVGDTVTVIAMVFSKPFDKWVVVSGDLVLTPDQKTENVMSFVMPDSDVVLRSTYNGEWQTYTVDVTGGTVNGSDATQATVYEESYVRVECTVPEGAMFVRWEATGVDLDKRQEKSRHLQFFMPKNDVQLKAVFGYPLSVEGGVARRVASTVDDLDVMTSGNVSIQAFGVNDQVAIEASVPEGMHFVRWEAEGIELTDLEKRSEQLTIAMPSRYVVLKASFGYNVTVEGGSADGFSSYAYEAGAQVTVLATVPEGKSFVKWDVTGFALEDEQITSPIVNFVMPKGDIILRAEFEDAAPEPQPEPQPEPEPVIDRLLSVVDGLFPDADSKVVDPEASEEEQELARRTVEGYVVVGTQVEILPMGTPEGKVFDHWEVTAKTFTLTDEQLRSHGLTITMPDEDVQLQPIYRSEFDPQPEPQPPASEYKLTVVDGTFAGSNPKMVDPEASEEEQELARRTVEGEVAVGETVGINAKDAQEGLVFDHWLVTAKTLTLTDEQLRSEYLEITMPTEDVQLQSVYRDESAPPSDQQPEQDQQQDAQPEQDQQQDAQPEQDQQQDAQPEEQPQPEPQQDAQEQQDDPQPDLQSKAVSKRNLTAVDATFKDAQPKVVDLEASLEEQELARRTVESEIIVGSKVEVKAGKTPDGKVFDHWKVTAKTFTLTDDELRAEVVSITMPDENVQLQPVYRDKDAPQLELTDAHVRNPVLA